MKDAWDGMRRARALGRSLLARYPQIPLVLVAAAPFVPGAWQFIHRGLPDVLFTGDGAVIEIRTLHAAHGSQLLGPYSRFHWSHPGPAFFYLALPMYEAFRRHGTALNLFAFVANLACAVAIVLAARRLRGGLFALAVAALLAIYECLDAPFQLSALWNPVVPILPLGLLSLWGARLALGNLRTLPPFAFVASAVVQTHVGFVPEVLFLSAMAAAFPVGRWLLHRPWRPRVANHDENDGERAHGHPWGVLAVTAIVLAVVWLPPMLDRVLHPPGNLSVLYHFFKAPHPPEHSWPQVLDTVSRELAHVPLVVAQAMGASTAPSAASVLGIAAAEVAALLAAGAWGLRRGDRALTLLSAIGLGEIATAALSVHAIRGAIDTYLVTWISMVGLVALVGVLAWPVAARARGSAPSRAAAAGIVLASLASLVFCVRAEAHSVEVFGARDENAERFARDIRDYLLAANVRSPMIRIPGNDAWPTGAAVVLYLYNEDWPVAVGHEWLFMMGSQFAGSSSGHPELLIGDPAFCASAPARADWHFVASAPDVCAYLTDPNYARDHRIADKVTVLAADGVRGDTARLVDGVTPADGAPWDSPLSLVLDSTASSVVVTVPQTNVAAVLLSVDGDDVYAVRCSREDGQPVPLGTVHAFDPSGMGTVLLFSNELRSCRTLQVRAERGDGYYSLGEIAFLRP